MLESEILIPENEKAEQFTQAMEYIEDGMYEEACDILANLTRSFPDDRGIWWQYGGILRRARRYDTADEVADTCYRLFPDDPGFVLGWTRCFDARADWDQCIERRREVLKTIDPRQDHRFLPLITECFLPLVETKNFDELKRLVNAYWDTLIEEDSCGAAVYYALESIADFERQIELCEGIMSRHDYDDCIIEGVNYLNLKSLAQSALVNSRNYAKSGTMPMVLSIGQSCLPYTVANRWGLLSYVGDPNVSVFDLGAFGNNSAVVALKSDFATYLDPTTYFKRSDHVGAPQMHHRPTGVHFGHERGRSIIGDDDKKFHTLIRKKIDTFRSRFEKGNVLLVYGIVGGVDLPAFVAEIGEYLDRTGATLFIVNFTRDALDCPAHSHVRFAHIPFPVDYNWNDIAHFTADRGFAFDHRFVSALICEMERLKLD
ncbi:tetratricopeptide repeat protein [Gluconobacter cerinus]|uniref:tetratricopeptide repeat protein n=1 Tax=Gluconobacter cerinus TaxID=38307 RepID=UPI001B8D053A|nr:tetratricopeptide repeat protein [Gluconobacter cerinus]MBS1033363.1 tetratricopeptide repeat protein [Gluconobacter cerinus]